MTSMAFISSESFDEFAVALTATVYNDHQQLTRVILDPEVPLSQVLLAALVANVAHLSAEAYEHDASAADMLPEFLAALRCEVCE